MPVKESDTTIKVGISKDLWKNVAMMAAYNGVTKKAMVAHIIEVYIGEHSREVG